MPDLGPPFRIPPRSALDSLGRSAPDVVGVGHSPIVQKAKTFFQYGNDAALKSNLDYAIDMYQQACKIDPDNLIYRQALAGGPAEEVQQRPVEGRDAGRGQEPADPDAGASRRGRRGTIAQSLEICEEAFTHNPWDIAHGTRGRRGGRGGRLSAAGRVVHGVGPGAGEGRRLLPPRRPRLRAQRALAQGDRLLGAGQEAQPQRRERQPADQRPVGQRHDQAGRPERGARKQAPTAVGESAEDDAGQARAAQAGAAHPRGALAQGDPGQPEPDLALPQAGRALPQPQPARRGREDPGPRASRPIPTTRCSCRSTPRSRSAA